MVKTLPAMQETWVASLDQEDPLEKEMATHSSTLAWESPCTEEPGGLQSMGSQIVRHDCATKKHLSIHMLCWVTGTLTIFCSPGQISLASIQLNSMTFGRMEIYCNQQQTSQHHLEGRS